MTTKRKSAAPRPSKTNPIAERRQRRKETLGVDERRAEVVEAASKVFSRLGYADATLYDVAKELGVNRATLYYYVESKVDLLAAVIFEPIRQMLSEVRAAAEAETTTTARLRAVIATHARFLAGNYTGLDLLFAQRDIQRGGKHGQLVRRQGIEYAAFIEGILKEGQRSGELRADLNPHIVTMSLTGALNWLDRWYDDGQDIEQIIDTFTRVFLDGVLTESAREQG